MKNVLKYLVAILLFWFVPQVMWFIIGTTVLIKVFEHFMDNIKSKKKVKKLEG